MLSWICITADHFYDVLYGGVVYEDSHELTVRDNRHRQRLRLQSVWGESYIIWKVCM